MMIGTGYVLSWGKMCESTSCRSCQGLVLTAAGTMVQKVGFLYRVWSRAFYRRIVVLLRLQKYNNDQYVT